MQVFDINLEPGKVRLIDQMADYVYFLNGSAGGADTTIVIRPESGGDAVYLKPGQAYKFNPNEMAARWAITNHKGEATIVGQLLFSVGTFTDNRVSGSVEVIDGGRARTAAGVAFLGGNNQVGVAGQLSNVQLWNPAGSGKIVVVKEVSFSGDMAGLHSIKSGAERAATVSGNGTSKRIGGAVSAAQLTIGTGNLGTMAYLYSVQASANQNYVKTFSEPLVLMPGYGLFVTSFNQQENLFANFEWVEEQV